MGQPLFCKQLSNQTLRILTAFILIPLVIGSFWLGFPYFDLLVTIVGGIMLKEWGAMSLKISSHSFTYALFSLILMPLYINRFLGEYFFFFSGLMALFFIYKERCAYSFKEALFYLLGVFYISWSTYIVLYLSHIGLGFYFLWILTIIWACDSGAYFVGKKIGGAKLAPRISPNKTWSGFMGGIFAALLVGMALSGALQTIYKTWEQIGWVCLYFALVSHGGDLLESSVKRYFKVKDSGSLIPGHGGVLDRMDSTLLSSFAAALLMIFNH